MKKSEEFCAPKKGSKHNENLFLNPVLLKDIEDYFEFQMKRDDVNDPSNVDIVIIPDENRTVEEKAKADYTINLLLLNHKILKSMRAKVFNEFKTRYDKAKDQSLFLEIIFDEESEDLHEFFSMLKKMKPFLIDSN